MLEAVAELIKLKKKKKTRTKVAFLKDCATVMKLLAGLCEGFFRVS